MNKGERLNRTKKPPPPSSPEYNIWMCYEIFAIVGRKNPSLNALEKLEKLFIKFREQLNIGIIINNIHKILYLKEITDQQKENVEYFLSDVKDKLQYKKKKKLFKKNGVQYYEGDKF